RTGILPYLEGQAAEGGRRLSGRHIGTLLLRGEGGELEGLEAARFALGVRIADADITRQVPAVVELGVEIDHQVSGVVRFQDRVQFARQEPACRARAEWQRHPR